MAIHAQAAPLVLSLSCRHPAAAVREVRAAPNKGDARAVRVAKWRRPSSARRVRLQVSQQPSSMASEEKSAGNTNAVATEKAAGDDIEIQKLNQEYEEFTLRKERQAVMKASKYGSVPLEEKERSLSDYMALPPSQYSVLDGSKIVRLTDDTFRCEMDTISFFGYSVKPILTAKVELRERGCCITVVGAKILGNSVVEKANDNFVLRSENIVEWKAEESGSKSITSIANTEVRLVVPKWSPVPTQVVNSTGSFILQKTLDVVVPRFLKQLSRDYANWSAGDDSRQPVG